MSLAILLHFLCAQHFRTLIYPSSGACDCAVELPHWSYCSGFDVCWSFGVVGLEWFPCRRLQPANDIKLVFYSSTITMTHGPINIKITLIDNFSFSPHFLQTTSRIAP